MSCHSDGLHRIQSKEEGSEASHSNIIHSGIIGANICLSVPFLLSRTGVFRDHLAVAKPLPTFLCCSSIRPPQIPRPGDQCVLQATAILLTLHSHSPNISSFKTPGFLLGDWWHSTEYRALRKVTSWDMPAAANPAGTNSTKDYEARSPKP